MPRQPPAEAADVGRVDGVVPWFAIGGIDLGNVEQVVEAGARRIVVVRAITEAEDPAAAAAASLPPWTPPAPETGPQRGPIACTNRGNRANLIFVSHHRLTPNVHEQTNALAEALSALRTELELPGAFPEDVAPGRRGGRGGAAAAGRWT